MSPIDPGSLPRTVDELSEWLRYRPGRRPMIVAHRGSPRPHEAENALATFEGALARGATFVELDIKETRDGVLVLNHDATLDRSTTGTGPLAERTWAELQGLRLRSLDGAPTDQPMLSLDEALDWARGRTLIWFDVKPPVTFARVLEHLRARDALGMGVTLTFTLADTLAAHTAAPDAMIYTKTPDENAVHELLGSGIPLDRLIAKVQPDTPASVYDLLHGQGLSISYPGWEGPDRIAATQGPRAYEHGMTSGCDLVNTDRIETVREAIEIWR